MTTGRTIAITNQKGGVGKTTTAVNLAAGLAHAYGKRVLVVDMDAQANATRALMSKELSPEQPTMRHVLTGTSSLRDILLQTPLPNMCIAPADLNLSEAEFKLFARPRREFLLRDSLRSGIPSFDYIIIDCPPSLGLLSLNALTAADGVIIPCETQYLSLRGLRHVLEVVGLVQQSLNPGLRVLGVLATMFHALSRANQESLEYLRKLKHVHVFKACVPRDVKAEECTSHGLPLALYASESRAAREYAKLTDEVIQLCQN
jgi:chromosome partitioning protein